MSWRKQVRSVFGISLVVFATPLFAQANPVLTEAERGIRTGDDRSADHLRVDELLVTATLAGRTADLSVEMVIASDSVEPFEGKLALVLPLDAVVTGFALNVGNRMIPAQLLDNPKARNLYEDHVRAGIDPGLGEISADNLFTTRVFPISRSGPRRIRIDIAAPVDPERGLVWPLSIDAKLGQVTVAVTARGHATAPTVRFAGEDVPLTSDGSVWRGGRTTKGALREGLAISGAVPVGAMSVTQHSGGERFFAISGEVIDVPVNRKPGRLRVYWDRSLSHGRGDPKLEADVLVQLAERQVPGTIDLITFASDRPTIVPVADAGALKRSLAGVTYLGGTSLARLDGLRLAPATRCVLVSDGQVTIDRDAPFLPDCPLSVLAASPGADGPRLGRLAEVSGGSVVRVVDGRVEEAAQAIARGGTGIISVRDEDGRRLTYRSLPVSHGRWQIVGPLPLTGGVQVRTRDGIERSYSPATDAVPLNAAGALWAAQEVQRLDDDPSRHDAMVSFARRYSVAGPAMSLLVLEEPDQYVEAKLAPPDAFAPDWMARYRAAKQAFDEAALDDRRERFDFVLSEWNDRKSWWSKTFTPDRLVKKSRAEADVPVVAAPAYAPPPMVARPSPPAIMTPPAPAEAVSADAAQSIVVTSSRSQTPPAPTTAPQNIVSDIQLELTDLTTKRPYIDALRAASPSARAEELKRQEAEYGTVPSFYLDTADWFRANGDTVTADLLLLSSLELPLSDDETRQIVAFRLERDGNWDRSVELAEGLAAANAEFRPQPTRDLALALAARGRASGPAGRADLERAFKLLVGVALNPASEDFDGFEVIALMEANALIPDIKAADGRWELDPRLVALLDTAVRIVIEWTADDADIDLWVTEPNGERVYYGDKLSSAGGLISNDMTDGYGPEEYVIHRAPIGRYPVRVNGYDADRINPNGPGHVLIRLFRNFARTSEQARLVDLDLAFQDGRNRDEVEGSRPVAELTVGK